MAWIKTDDGEAEHPKILELISVGPAGYQAYYMRHKLMQWCARGPIGTERRDIGHIPDAAARNIGATPRITGLLESVGLIDRNGTGWLIHDWTDYQKVDRTAAERKRRERGKDT